MATKVYSRPGTCMNPGYLLSHAHNESAQAEQLELSRAIRLRIWFDGLWLGEITVTHQHPTTMPHHPPQLQPSHLTSHAPHAPPVGHPSPNQCQQYQPQPSLAEMAHLFALQMQNHQKLAEEQFLQQKQLFQLFSAMVPAQQAPILNPQPSVYPQAPLLPVQYNLHLQNEQTNLSQQNRAPTTGNSVSMVNVGDYCSNTSYLVGNDAYNLNKAQSGEKMVNKTVMPRCWDLSYDVDNQLVKLLKQ
ncbi:hypothetical protein LguiA_007506 [Lonicera macranthoides]